jgi:hypothetical protein
MKETKTSTLKKILYGANSRVHTFGILTSENPMGKKTSPSYNAKSREELEQYLKKLRYDYIPVQGSYGSLEKSYFIINPNLEDLANIGNKFKQQSFIYGKSTWSSDFENRYTNYYYFEKESSKGNYKKRDETTKVTSDKQAKDFFTRIKSFKFNINFPIFEELIKQAERLIVEKYNHISDDILIEGIVSNLSKKYTTQERWRRRCFLYESLEDKIARCKKLKESSLLNGEDSKYLPEEVFELERKGLI